MRALAQTIKPARVRLETSTACQLKCPACSTALGKIGNNIGTGFLRFGDFKKLGDHNPWVRAIELSNWGEMFLNPDLLTIIQYAYQKRVVLRADNGVNLNTASEEQLEALVRHRFHSMTCSIDGASQETYVLYRKRGNFERVISHIKKINEYKRKYRSPRPALRWQFVAFGHNEHEIHKAEQMAKTLHMSFSVKLSWTGEKFSPVKDRDLIRKKSGLGVADRKEYHEKYGPRYLQKQFCAQLWRNPQINWDGRVLGCCVNYWGDFGNAFQEGLEQALNNEKIAYARQMLFGKKPAREDIPCTRCPCYQTMQQDQRWLTGDDVSRYPMAEVTAWLKKALGRGMINIRRETPRA